MAKNIVVCCDGTDNMLTLNKNTNVVHLYSCLEKNSDQVTYYHPGVGTIAPEGAENWISKQWLLLKDMAYASSIEKNVKDAYIFLMDNYESGDRIYLFGFSRGAYTVRMLSGLIQMFGLLEKGNALHLRYALEIYSKGDKLFPLANSFRSRFSRTVDIHFIGVWDTVVAAGGLINFYKSYPYSRSLGIAKTVRHAVAIDEKRKHYYYYEVSPEHKDCVEVFFAGVHSNVGGSYTIEGLSKLALEWMLGEASQSGLRLVKEKVERYVYGIGSNYQKPDCSVPIENSLTLGFRIFDFIPRPRFSKSSRFFNMKLDFRLWPKRVIKDGASVHESVFQKRKIDQKYKPTNLNPDQCKYHIVNNRNIMC